MKVFRTKYLEVHNWEILEKKTVHDFTENENSINIVKVLIGTLIIEEIDTFNQKYNAVETPIVRWITEKEYQTLKNNEGVIIW